MIVNGLFPTPVIKFELGRQLTDQEMKVLMDYPQVRNQGNAASEERYVLKNKKLRSLKMFAEECLAKYVEAVYAPSEPFKLDITQSWTNYTNQNEFHHKHSHPNSMVSGVFYVSANEETDKIHFFRKETDTFRIYTENYNPFNSVAWWFPVKTGELIMFPSYLEHMVETVQSSEMRVSLAFNSFATGSLGGLMDSCKLVIRGVE